MGMARNYHGRETAGGKRRSSTDSTPLIAVQILRSKSLFLSCHAQTKENSGLFQNWSKYLPFCDGLGLADRWRM